MLCHKFLGLLESRSARRLLFSCPARRHLGVRVCPAPILLRARCGGLWCGLAKPRPGASREGGGESACVCTCVRRGCRETCMPLAAGWSWLPRVDSVHDFPCFRRKESGLGWCRVESLRQSGVESSYTVGRQAGRQAGRCGTTRRTAGGARECCPSSVDAFGGHSLLTFWRSRGERKRGSATESLPRERDGGTRRRGHLGPGISPTDASRRVVVGIGVSASPTKPESAKGKTGAGGGGRKAGACRS